MVKLNSYQIAVIVVSFLDKIQSQIRNMTVRVVGGQFGAIEMFPHAVCLVNSCSNFEDDIWICGSSILSQRILLTAAHCVFKCRRNSDDLEAIAGSSNIEKVYRSILVKNYRIHEEYEPQDVKHDIALCKLQSALPLGRNIRRVIIRSSFSRSEEGFVAGWGQISRGGDMSPYIKWVKQKLWRARECQKIDDVTPAIMCASSGSSKHFPFGGDSGSALITSYYQQIGLVSYQIERRPDVIFYANVSYYYNWIRRSHLYLYCDRDK